MRTGLYFRGGRRNYTWDINNPRVFTSRSRAHSFLRKIFEDKPKDPDRGGWTLIEWETREIRQTPLEDLIIQGLLRPRKKKEK